MHGPLIRPCGAPPPLAPRQAYKAVAALLDRQLRRAQAASERLNVLYAAHKVLGASRKELHSKSRYREALGGGGRAA